MGTALARPGEDQAVSVSFSINGSRPVPPGTVEHGAKLKCLEDSLDLRNPRGQHRRGPHVLSFHGQHMVGWVATWALGNVADAPPVREEF